MGDEELTGEKDQDGASPASEELDGVVETVDPAKEINGLKQAYIAERNKRQEVEKRLQRTEIQADEAYKKTLLYDSLIEQSRHQEPQYDPGDIPTFADVERITQENLRKAEQSVRDSEINQMVERERAAHPDWDDMFEIAKRVADETPGLDAVIMKTKNPARTAYKLGQAHSLTGKKGEEAAQKLKETIDKNLKSSTLGTVGSGGQGTPKAKMPEPGTPEFQARINKIKGY
jgi:hypothetical protein